MKKECGDVHVSRSTGTDHFSPHPWFVNVWCINMHKYLQWIYAKWNKWAFKIKFVHFSIHQYTTGRSIAKFGFFHS